MLVTMSIYISNKEHSGHLYWNSNKKGKGFSKSMLKNHSTVINKLMEIFVISYY